MSKFYIQNKFNVVHGLLLYPAKHNTAKQIGVSLESPLAPGKNIKKSNSVNIVSIMNQ